MRNIFAYIFSGILFLLLHPSALGGQDPGKPVKDTMRTVGPRIGINLVPFVNYFTSPPVFGAEASLDFEIAENFFPVFEAGTASISDSIGEVSYSASGIYGRIGMDYNLLPPKDRSVQHAFTAGFRYGISLMQHKANNIRIPADYWGDYLLQRYENTLAAHWIELVGGIRAEVLPNFYLGWTIRYRILLNPGMDEQLTPLHIPGYGKGAEDRGIGFSYTVSYMFPIMKR